MRASPIRSFLIAGTALAALALPAWAQDHRDDHRDDNRGGHHDDHAPPAAAPAAAPAPQPGTPPGGLPTGARNGVRYQTNAPPPGMPNGGGPRPAAQPAPAPQAQPNRGNGYRGHDDHRPQAGFNPGPGRPGAGPGPGGPRHDYSSFRDYHRGFNAQHRFHAPAYRRPPGWYDRRWNYGDILPALFWSQAYWLTNYAGYDLLPPPYGAVWVRNGSDALLIDQGSGEIITVEYGVFY